MTNPLCNPTVIRVLLVLAVLKFAWGWMVWGPVALVTALIAAGLFLYGLRDARA